MGATRPQPARSFRTTATRLVGPVLILCTVALTGCGKTDHIIQPTVTSRYPVLSSPKNVLIALQLAYSNRDSVEYSLLFHDNYAGTSTDYASPSPDTLKFAKADERAHIGALAKSHSISSVHLDFSPSLVRSTDPSDSAGWATIQIPYLNLQIDDTPETWSLASSGEAMEFKFKPTTPAPTSPTDTTWKIIRWIEVHN